MPITRPRVTQLKEDVADGDYSVTITDGKVSGLVVAGGGSDIRFSADGVTCSGPGTVEIVLSYVPTTTYVSEHVYWNGVWLDPSQWIKVDGGLIYVNDADGMFEADDEVWCEYAHYDEVYVPPNPEIMFIGTTVQDDSLTSIALPLGTQEGDLIVVPSIAWGSVSSSDPRLIGDSGLGSPDFIKWGYEDGSGDPISIIVEDSAFDWATTSVSVFRNVKVEDWDLASAGSSPGSFNSLPSSFAAIGAIIAKTGTIAGGLNTDSTLDWTEVSHGDDVKVYTSVNTWESLTSASTPVGSFAMSGTFTAMFLVVLKLKRWLEYA